MKKEKLLVVIGVVIVLIAVVIAFLAGKTREIKDVLGIEDNEVEIVKVEERGSNRVTDESGEDKGDVRVASASPTIIGVNISLAPKEKSGNVDYIPPSPTKFFKPEVTRDPKKIIVPDYVSEYKSKKTIDPMKGKISFKVKADWGERDGDRVLFLGNFDGDDRKGLFEVIGVRNLLIFETYGADSLSNSFGAPDADLGVDYFGKTFKVELTWDFGGERQVKRIFIDGEERLEMEVEGPYEKALPKMYVGKSVEDLEIE